MFGERLLYGERRAAMFGMHTGMDEGTHFLGSVAANLLRENIPNLNFVGFVVLEEMEVCSAG